MIDVIDVVETNDTFVNLSPYGEPQLGRRGLYRGVGGGSSEELALLWVLSLSDGTNSLLDIADAVGSRLHRDPRRGRAPGGARPRRARGVSGTTSRDADPSLSDALVTGASGFLGSRLVARLVERGTTVTCTTRAAGPPSNDRVVWRECDLTEPASVAELFTATRPAVVFHLASHVSGLREPENVHLTLAGNLTAAVNVLLAALEVGSRRVVLAGSYEEPEPGTAPRSPYAAAKAGATAYARMFSSLYGLSTVVLRPVVGA